MTRASGENCRAAIGVGDFYGAAVSLTANESELTRNEWRARARWRRSLEAMRTILNSMRLFSRRWIFSWRAPRGISAPARPGK
jgi:hypothetical protein